MQVSLKSTQKDLRKLMVEVLRGCWNGKGKGGVDTRLGVRGGGKRVGYRQPFC